MGLSMSAAAPADHFSVGKLAAQIEDENDNDGAPRSAQNGEAPGRQTGAMIASTLGRSSCAGLWGKAKLVTELDGKPPESASPWGKTLNEGQRLAREERVIQSRLENSGLTFNELWADRERERSSKALSDTYVLNRDIGLVKKRMRASKRGLLDPLWPSVQVFDLLMLLVLLYTVVVTPYEIGLVRHSGWKLQLTNDIINVIFFLGIVEQFVLPFRESPKKGGRLIKKHSEIAWNYIRNGPFVLDVITTIPYDHIVNAIYTIQGEEGTDTRTLRMLRMLRAVRLLKLGRLIHSSRILMRMSELAERYLDFNVSHATRTVVFWTFALLILIHWYVCWWNLLAQLMATQRSDVLEAARLANGQCQRGLGDCLSECEMELLAGITRRTIEFVHNAETWVCHAIANGGVPENISEEHWQLYVFVLGSDLSGPGFVTPTSTPEYATNFVFQFIMLIISNIFVGVVATAQSEADPLGKAFKARMDHLNHFLDDVNATDELKRRTREYFRSTKELVAKQTFGDLFEMFSPMLRGDVLSHISKEVLMAVPFFRGCEDSFLREISQKLKHYGYEAGDRVKVLEPTLCIVTRGTAVLGGKPITRNQYWGEDMIVSSAALRDSRIAVGLTYIEIVCLTRSELLESMENHEASAHAILVESMRLSMIRAPQLIARYLQSKAKDRGRVYSTGHPQKDQPTPRSTKKEVHALAAGLSNIGKGAKFEHREYHAVMKRINGNTPLRGFAREQRYSADGKIASLAVNALGVAGDEGKLLIDEEGRVVGADGKTVEVVEDSEDTAKLITAMRLEQRADYKALQAQIDSLKALVQQAVALGPVMSKVRGHTKSSPEEGGVIHIRRRRTRHRVDGTDRHATDRQIRAFCHPSANGQSASTAAEVIAINSDLSAPSALSASLLQAPRLSPPSHPTHDLARPEVNLPSPDLNA